MFESVGAPDLVEVLLEEERCQAVSQARQLRIIAELSRRSPEWLDVPGRAGEPRRGGGGDRGGDRGRR